MHASARLEVIRAAPLAYKMVTETTDVPWNARFATFRGTPSDETRQTDSTCPERPAVVPGTGRGKPGCGEPVFVAEPAGLAGCNPRGVLLLPPPSLVLPGALGDVLLATAGPAGRPGRGAPRRDAPMKRVAVVGSGIAGLAAARALSGPARVTLYEAGDHFGGHAHTVDVAHGGMTHGVDCGFLVFNERTYPRLVALFAELGVETAASEMSFSAQVPAANIEWGGASLGSVFAQRANLLRPAFLRMLSDVVRFNRIATARATDALPPDAANDDSVGDFLDAHRFCAAFRDWYFLPMIGCIWSCPTEQMLRFPVATLLRFCHNHGLLQIADRPQWYTVRGGSRSYVTKMLARVADARLSTPVRLIKRLPMGGADVSTDRGTERFDAVILATHSDQSLALLVDPNNDEREVLGAIRFQPNRAILHTDVGVLPRRKAAWAAWNYERSRRAGDTEPAVCLHYLINRLQPLPFATPVIVSLNPVSEPDAASVHGEFHYSHPVFDRRALAAQARLPALQGHADTWFCGAWTGYGFHEDGLSSGLAVAADIIARLTGAAQAPARGRA